MIDCNGIAVTVHNVGFEFSFLSYKKLNPRFFKEFDITVSRLYGLLSDFCRTSVGPHIVIKLPKVALNQS